MWTEHVKEVYDKIAPHFNETRRSMWSGVERFVHSLPKGSAVLDVGCGNARYVKLRDDLVWTCIDTCVPIIEIASNENEHTRSSFAVADGLNLPFRTGGFDACISIAVMHHMPTFEMRKRFVDELIRVVRPGGHVYLTVWSRSAIQGKKKWVPLHGESGADYLVPWHDKNTGDVHHRYYHLFEESELQDLFKHLFEHKHASRVYVGFEMDNWTVEAKKVL